MAKKRINLASQATSTPATDADQKTSIAKAGLVSARAATDSAILNSSAQGDIISDFFAGSGSMIIAAAKHHRKAYCMELSPQFCHVIIKRWEGYTGLTAKRE